MEKSSSEQNEIMDFLSIIKNCDGNKLKTMRFEGEIYNFPLENEKPTFQLRRLYNGEIEICKIFNDDNKIVIPNQIDNMKVVGIGKNACANKKKLESLEIQDGIKYIETGAFSNCTKLRNIKISNYVAIIGSTDNDGQLTHQGAFENCGIEYVILPKSLKKLGANTFRNCYNLKKIEIPNKVKKIEKYCFWKCVNLEQIILPLELTDIEKGAFYGCKTLQKLDIPSTLIKIHPFALQNCLGLSKINLNSIQEVGVSVFRGCAKLKSSDFRAISSHKHAFN